MTRRLARYRASAAACNRCPLKSGCTDSDDGREVTRALDPWLESELGRFQQGLSLVLAVLPGLIVTVGLIRSQAVADVLPLAPVVLVVVLAVRQRLGVLRRPSQLAWNSDTV